MAPLSFGLRLCDDDVFTALHLSGLTESNIKRTKKKTNEKSNIYSTRHPPPLFFVWVLLLYSVSLLSLSFLFSPCVCTAIVIRSFFCLQCFSLRLSKKKKQKKESETVSAAALHHLTCEPSSLCSVSLSLSLLLFLKWCFTLAAGTPLSPPPFLYSHSHTPAQLTQNNTHTHISSFFCCERERVDKRKRGVAFLLLCVVSVHTPSHHHSP